MELKPLFDSTIAANGFSGCSTSSDILRRLTGSEDTSLLVRVFQIYRFPSFPAEKSLLSSSLNARAVVAPLDKSGIVSESRANALMEIKINVNNIST